MEHDPDAPPTRKQLMKDLDRVAQLHYRRAFGPKPASMPDLGKVVRARHGGILNVETLHDTLLLAVEQALSPTECPPDVEATYRQLGCMLFLNVLPDDELPPDDRDGRRRYSKLLDQITLLTPGGTDKSRQLIIRRVRGRMADFLLANSTQQSKRQTPPTLKQTYIDRPALETTISKALKDRSKPVVLWGPSGNGKSTLARHLTGMMPKHSVVVLQGPVIPGTEFEEDLNEALDRYGIRREGQLLGEKLRALANALAAGSELNVIVLDNVTPGSVDAASLTQGGAAVIVTSRERFPKAGHQLIRIEEYQPEEAVAAAEAITGRPSTDRTELLLRLLGRRPIAVNIACRLIAEAGVSIEDLLSACTDDAGEALEAGSVLLDDSPSPAVKAVYRELVRVLRADRFTPAVLLVIVWVMDLTEPELIGRVAQALCDLPASDFRMRAAIEKLEIFGVVDRRNDALAINDLSLNILRAVLADDADTILHKVYHLVQKSTAAKTQADLPVGIRVFWTYGYACNAKQVQLATGSRTFGAVPVNALQSLVWQQDNKLFPADSTGLEVALLDHRFGENVLYYKGRHIDPCDEIALFGLVRLSTAHNLVMRYVSELPAPLSLEAESQPAVQHIALSTFPRRTERSQLLWAWCGSWFWRTPEDDPGLAPCEQCEYALASQQTFMSLLDELSCYWAVARELSSEQHRSGAAELILGSLAGLLLSHNAEGDLERALGVVNVLVSLVNFKDIEVTTATP
ncbi:MAG: hypothetical protein ACJ74U_18995 [Jatrophihabitantaceae bacterium]